MSIGSIWFSEIIDHCHILPQLDRLKDILNRLNLSHDIQQALVCELKNWFFWIKRKDGSHYILHLLTTSQIFSRYCAQSNISISPEDSLIALLHDSIEDTGATFETLEEKFWGKIALWVSVLSKKPLAAYHDGRFRDIQAQIKNETWEDIGEEMILKNYNWNISPELRKSWESYEKNLKVKRNQDYFKNFSSLELLEKHIIAESRKRGISFVSESERKKFVRKIAIIKLSDRLHNIKTLPVHDSSEQKILETTTHLISLAWEVCPQLQAAIGNAITQYQVRKTTDTVECIL